MTTGFNASITKCDRQDSKRRTGILLKIQHEATRTFKFVVEHIIVGVGYTLYTEVNGPAMTSMLTIKSAALSCLISIAQLTFLYSG
ncbi:hypothetical protein CEXT_434111 [Caerostris extrusa]|uniref:Uncharacterized protein n=1 Tax=Caerostris extrusa TaxID=172846 RepID=A0AAV4MG73_CAEEX|nr:hypothetical protein CEXT_434111 [Caerostris extrusa]